MTDPQNPPLVRRIPLLLGALCIVHVVLAIWFASVTPYRTGGRIGRSPAIDVGAPDERQHANYIQSIVAGEGFPLLDVDRMHTDPTYRAERYEDHQPPLYYVLAAGWSKATGIADVTDPAAGARVRALNALIGGGTVVGVFLAAYWGFRRVELAFAAALFPALLPMNIALSGAVSNDPLLFALMAWAMAIVARAVREGWSLKLALLAGILTGLAILTKTTGLALAPVILVAAVIPQFRRPSVLQIVAAALALVVIAAPWLMRNQRVYHDPLAASVFEKAFSDNPHKADMVLVAAQDGGNPELGYWANWVGWWTARSFIGTFGYMDVWLNESGTHATVPGKAPNTLYRVCLAALALLALGWLRSLSEPWVKEAQGVILVNTTLLVVVVLLFVRFNNQFFQGQARYLYPALVPLSIGFGSGVVVWFKGRPWIGTLVAAACLLGLDIYSGVRLPAEFAKRTGAMSASNWVSSSNVQ